MVRSTEHAPTDSASSHDSTQPHNRRTVEASSDPAQAGAEQDSSWTPTSGPSAPAPGGGTPDAILWGLITGLAVVSVVIPLAFGGGGLWLVTAVMFPLLAAWVAVQVVTGRREEARS